jgi:uncharacterized membrane protein
MTPSWIAAFYQLLNQWGYTHPLHPALVHFPIGLIGGGLILGGIGTLFRREPLVRSARHCLILAFIFWFPVVLFGYMDWQHFYGGVWLTPIKIKVLLSIILFFLLLSGLLNEFRKGRNSHVALVIYILLIVTAAGLGFMGAQLVYGSKPPAPSKTRAVGEQVFIENCRSCHPNGGNTVDPQHPIVHSPRMNTLAVFTDWLRHPAPTMPAFPENRLSSGQVQALYDYLNDPTVFPPPK